MPKTKLPWAVVVSTMPLVSDRTPTPRVCRVVTMSTRSRRLQIAAEPVNFPEDQGLAAAQVGQAGVPLRTVGFGADGGVGVGLQAVRGVQGVELQSGVLVGGGHPCVSDSVAHGHAHYRNPWPRGGSVGLNMG